MQCERDAPADGVKKITDLSTQQSIPALFQVDTTPADRRIAGEMLAQGRAGAATFSGTRRELYDAMTAQTPIAPDVGFSEVQAEPVSGWWVRPTGASDGRAILFLHGGGYSLGTANAYRGLASQIAARSGVAVFVADYPLAPEAPFPAAYDAGLRAFDWIARDAGRRVALAGDSAGGGLALALLGHSDTVATRAAAIATFSPWTDLALAGASFNDPRTIDPIFNRETVSTLAKAYLSGADARDGRASPLYRISPQLPPTLIQVGTHELLLDDAKRYAVEAERRGAQVRVRIYEGMHHVFQRAAGRLRCADQALDEASSFLATHLRDEA